jgi:hypothetical protein
MPSGQNRCGTEMPVGGINVLSLTAKVSGYPFFYSELAAINVTPSEPPPSAFVGKSICRFRGTN